VKVPKRVMTARADFRRRLLQQSADGVSGKPDVTRSSILLDAPGGPAIEARLYKTTPSQEPGKARQGIIVFFHSGAFVIGDLDTGDPVAAALCDSTGFDVVSIDYPLAPENPYPAAFTIGLRAARFISEEMKDGLSVIVAGDSAGGNLAASVTHALANEGVRVDAQLLFYPCLDLRGRYPRQLVAPDDFSIPEMLRWSYGMYLGENPPEDPCASPGLQTALTGLPPTVIAVGSHDPLRHEGIDYAERLTVAGVSSTLLSFNLMHGFVEHYAGKPEAFTAVSACAQILASEIARHRADLAVNAGK
jgi:acetyl esterase